MAIYYIDYGAANDSANGTAKTTPWKRCPGMATFAGSYSHAAGDQFIFKGGVTWPNACFPLTISLGGTSVIQDYYGVDATWYTGAAWARPIFDLESTMIAGNNRCILQQANYVTVENIEFIRFYWSDANEGSCIYETATAGSVWRYLYIHNWSHASYASGCRDTARLLRGSGGGVIEYCELDGSPNGTDSAMCIAMSGQEVRYDIVHETSNAILGWGVGNIHLSVHHNQIYDVNDSFDSGQHENGLELFGHGDVYNNIIHDIYAPGVTTLMGPGEYGAGDLYFYNNLLYGYLWSSPIQIDPNGNWADECDAYIYNNTILPTGDTWTAIRCVERGGAPYILRACTFRNNHIITTQADPIDERNVTTWTSSNNLIQTPTAATAQGYVLGNLYAPTSGGSTIDAGYALTGVVDVDINEAVRPHNSLWDIGAYEYEAVVSWGPLTRTNYTWASWNTQADGLGTDYDADETFAMGAEDVTLYAKWTAIGSPEYTVTYDGTTAVSGSVPTDANTYAESASVTVLGNTGSLAKYTYWAFTGWNTAADGSGTAYAPGATMTMPGANVILYAQWVIKSVIMIV